MFGFKEIDGFIPVFDRENRKRLLGYLPIPSIDPRLRAGDAVNIPVRGLPMRAFPEAVPAWERIKTIRVYVERISWNKGWITAYVLLTDDPIELLLEHMDFILPGETVEEGRERYFEFRVYREKRR